jgi:outer membrane protein TolC
VGKTDVNIARAGVLDLQSQAMAFRRERSLARIKLSHAMGLPRRDADWRISGALPAEGVPRNEHETLLSLAMAERLDARLAAAKARAAEDEIRRQYLSIFPNVTLGVEWERTEDRALPGRKLLADTARASIANGRLTAPSIQSRAERARERSQIIDSLLGPTLDITLPIWDQNQVQVAKARFEAVMARKALEAILDDVARDVDEALAVASSATELVAFFEQESLPLARISVNTAEDAYQAGQLDTIALIDAQKTLVAQREAAIKARRDCAIALAELRSALGGRLPSEMPERNTERPAPGSEMEGSRTAAGSADHASGRRVQRATALP